MSFEGFDFPSYTPIPDQLIDELMSTLSLAELRVALYIARRTYGFKKNSDAISLGQMLHGITKKDGTVLDKGTGICKRSLLPALSKLIEKKIIIRTKRAKNGLNQPSVYQLNLKKKPKSKEPQVVETNIAPTQEPSVGAKNSSTLGAKSAPRVEANFAPHKTQLNKKQLNKNSLSQVVDDFYRRLGRERISKTKRERGFRILEELQNDGFSEEELDHALKWLTTQHPDTKSLDRLGHMMDQALIHYSSEKIRLAAQQKQQTKRVQEEKRASSNRALWTKAGKLYETLNDEAKAKYLEKLPLYARQPFLQKTSIICLIAHEIKSNLTPNLCKSEANILYT